jgi:recombination protein RecA
MAKKKKKEEKAKTKLHNETDMDKVLTAMTKEFGDGSIMRMGDVQKTQDVATISTGSIALDEATGIGGFPRGRIVEIFGPEASGKTTITLHVIASAQRTGGRAAFIDAEHALDLSLAAKVGVDTDNLYLSQPDSGEQALGLVEMAVLSSKFDVVVVDSVAALVPRAEIEGEMGDSHMGLQARLMSQAMRKLSGIVAKSNTLVIFINQVRQKIGVMFGNPETTTGGNALKFYASMRIDIRRIGGIKQDGQEIGNQVKIKVVKNKLAPPFKVIETELIFGKGLNKESELMNIAHELEILEVEGSRWYYREELLANGKVNVWKHLQAHPELFDAILTDVKLARKTNENIKDL